MMLPRNLSVLCLLFLGTALSQQTPAPSPAPAVSLALPDSAAAAGTPGAEIVSLSTQGAFSQAEARVGDSLDYVLQVEWKDSEVPVVVLAPDSLSVTGFKLIGQATVHKKLAMGTDVKNHTDFIYRLRAATQGTGRIAALKLRYLSGISRTEEAAYVPAAILDIAPARVNLVDRLWFKLLCGLALLAALWAGIRALLHALKARKDSAPAKSDLGPEAAALKARIRSAAIGTVDSKDVLLEMEALCIGFLKQESGEPAVATAGDRFDPILDAHLKRAGSLSDGAAAQGPGIGGDWEKLRDLFRHARFAGGHKEAHELQDAYRTLKKCLNLTGDDEHE
jgi:hypothetical protein